MRLRDERQLAETLQRGLPRAVLLTSDEPLLVQEAADKVREAALAAGVDERVPFYVDSPSFDFRELLDSSASLSLFASRRLLELRLGSAGLGQQGSAAVLEWLAGDSDDVLLVLAPRLDARAQKAKWVLALEKEGVHLPLWPPGLDGMTRWVQQRLRRAQVTVDEEGLAFLVSRLEGNLLAAAQVVDRLALQGGGKAWTVENLAEELDDDARYTPFELIDAALAGDGARAHRMLAVLREEGLEPLALVALLARELRILLGLREAADRGSSLGAAMASARVLKRRQGLVERALRRLSRAVLAGALRDLALVDQGAKGMNAVVPFEELDRLLLRLAGYRTTPLALRSRRYLES
ncbi:MAG: DNA polymerase III subunit delta [Pseudomonadales bacterium]